MFDSVDSYYKFHSKIYDISRWTILFGKSSLLDLLPKDFNPDTILDLGCGTGAHLKNLHLQFPNASIIGVDASEEMLTKAASKIRNIPNISLQQSSIKEFLRTNGSFDLIVCSYSLSMFDDVPAIIPAIKNALNKSGFFLVVDFKSTPFSLFRKWMKFNHVDISGLVFSEIEAHFNIKLSRTKLGYLGLWKYAKYLSRK